MKYILILLVLPSISFARVPPLSCENSTVSPAQNHPEQLRSYYCDLNFRCTVNELNTDGINWDIVEQRRAYSMENDCNDELRLAAMMMEISKDPPELRPRVQVEVNESDRSELKDATRASAAGESGPTVGNE